MIEFPCLIMFDRISPISINPYEFWGFFSSILRANDLSITSVCSHRFGIQRICQPLFKVFRMAESSSSFRGPCFCRHMNKADEFIMCIPDDAASKLWGVYKGPTNVSIHTEDGRLFNVGLSASKGKIFFFHGWSKVVEHLRLTIGCLVLFNPIDSTTFKLTSFVDGVSHTTFWTYLLPPSSQFYVIPECILPKHYDYSSNDAEVPPLDVENETDEEIHGGVKKFVRMAGEDYFDS
ncbi:putative transcription factor B3-Domain family [Helianthus annuus]|uniref:Putative DNA-binding pseudobarrel domain-containing protein n=1 Tax=Helianthus annuus TaxID=4232 RepID=A0A251SCR0_HELAN|nr:putative transcription factor B3-Domain family [Helianthus annuus]KAJ0830764.1 putative transcription factor B3-Domain family [Helianthus annuus]